MNVSVNVVKNRLTVVNSTRPQRLSVWSARIMTTPTQNIPYSQAREIIPIIARTPDDVARLIWQTHQELCLDQITGAQTMNANQAHRAVLARFEVVRLADEVWSNYEFISTNLFTPI